jgi:competence protein ComK
MVFVVRGRINLITSRTMAVYPAYHEKYRSIILNRSGETIYSEKSIKDLIDEACIRGGASYEGRVKAVRHMLSYHKKTPVMISEGPHIIAYPTMSPQHYSCIWLFCSHIENFSRTKGKTFVHFKNGSMLEVSCSVKVLRTQMERAAATMNYFAVKPAVSLVIERKKEEEEPVAQKVHSSLLTVQSAETDSIQF